MASEADLWYNRRVNIVVLGGAVNTPNRINLDWRFIMNSVPHHASQKQCNACKDFFPATTEFFYKNKAKKDRLCIKCKACDDTARKLYSTKSSYKPHPRKQKYSIGKDGFWDNVDKSGDCWLWTGYVDRKGYGRFHTCYGTGKPHHTGTHRISYILTYGDIPQGMHVCHHCDNPRCVRPDHLFLGTHQDNMADKVAKGRGTPPPRHDGDTHWTRQHPENVARGENHPIAKLSLEQVKEIRANYATGNYTLAQLGKLYGVGKTHIHKIVNNLVWKGANE